MNVLSSSSIMEPSEVQRSSGDGPAPWSGCSGTFLLSSSVPCAVNVLRMASASRPGSSWWLPSPAPTGPCAQLTALIGVALNVNVVTHATCHYYAQDMQHPAHPAHLHIMSAISGPPGGTPRFQHSMVSHQKHFVF